MDSYPTDRDCGKGVKAFLCDSDDEDFETVYRTLVDRKIPRHVSFSDTVEYKEPALSQPCPHEDWTSERIREELAVIGLPVLEISTRVSKRLPKVSVQQAATVGFVRVQAPRCERKRPCVSERLPCALSEVSARRRRLYDPRSDPFANILCKDVVPTCEDVSADRLRAVLEFTDALPDLGPPSRRDSVASAPRSATTMVSPSSLPVARSEHTCTRNARADRAFTRRHSMQGRSHPRPNLIATKKTENVAEVNFAVQTSPPPL